MRSTQTVPAGVASGQQRPSGKGLSDEAGRTGDLYAVVRIEPPQAVDAEDRVLER
jgi:hypothetical protein